MKYFLLILVFWNVVFCSSLSFSKDFQKEYRTKIGHKTDILLKNISDLEDIVKDLDKIMVTSETITWKEMAAYQNILGNIDRCKITLFYEGLLYTAYGGLSHELDILYLYQSSKERYNLVKNNIVNVHIPGIKKVYGDIKNIAALHLIDNAIIKIKSSLELLETCLEIFESALPEVELIR